MQQENAAHFFRNDERGGVESTKKKMKSPEGLVNCHLPPTIEGPKVQWIITMFPT